MPTDVFLSLVHEASYVKCALHRAITLTSRSIFQLYAIA